MSRRALLLKRERMRRNTDRRRRHKQENRRARELEARLREDVEGMMVKRNWICKVCGNEWEQAKPMDCPHCASFEIEVLEHVITLRDFFAGCALIAIIPEKLIHKMSIDAKFPWSQEEKTQLAFEYADAMLKERERGSGG